MTVIQNLSIITGIFAGVSFLSVAGPVLGEMLATMAPRRNVSDIKNNSGVRAKFHNVHFRTDGGMLLHGWFYPSEKPDAPAVIYAPATNRDLRSGISLVDPLHDAGFNVLLFSYRGHGKSQGNPFGFTYGVEESKDVDAAVDFLINQNGINKIGVIGHSAGAVSCILSAARNSGIGAVVAVSPYNSIDEIWQTNRPRIFPTVIYKLTMRLSEKRKAFSRHDARPIDVISNISPRPILILHGSHDKRIRNNQIMNLYHAANYPKKIWIINGASHSGMRTPILDNLLPQIIRFLDKSFQI